MISTTITVNQSKYLNDTKEQIETFYAKVQKLSFTDTEKGKIVNQTNVWP